MWSSFGTSCCRRTRLQWDFKTLNARWCLRTFRPTRPRWLLVHLCCPGSHVSVASGPFPLWRRSSKSSAGRCRLTKWLKSLVGLTEVLEFHLQDLECRFHLNVGRYFQTKTGGGPKVLGNITDMVK